MTLILFITPVAFEWTLAIAVGMLWTSYSVKAVRCMLKSLKIEFSKCQMVQFLNCSFCGSFRSAAFWKFKSKVSSGNFQGLDVISLDESFDAISRWVSRYILKMNLLNLPMDLCDDQWTTSQGVIKTVSRKFLLEMSDSGNDVIEMIQLKDQGSKKQSRLTSVEASRLRISTSRYICGYIQIVNDDSSWSVFTSKCRSGLKCFKLKCSWNKNSSGKPFENTLEMVLGKRSRTLGMWTMFSGNFQPEKLFPEDYREEKR